MMYLITRHAAAQQFAAKRGFSNAKIIAHAGDEFWTGLLPGDSVVGTLPLHLAAKACEATGNPFGFLSVNTPPDKRGAELTLEEMERFGATIDWFNVEAAQPPKSE